MLFPEHNHDSKEAASCDKGGNENQPGLIDTKRVLGDDLVSHLRKTALLYGNIVLGRI